MIGVDKVRVLLLIALLLLLCLCCCLFLLQFAPLLTSEFGFGLPSGLFFGFFLFRALLL